jgi:hypothetical protein
MSSTADLLVVRQGAVEQINEQLDALPLADAFDIVDQLAAMNADALIWRANKIRALHANGLNDREIGDLVGRSRQRIAQLRAELGLSANDSRGGERTFDKALVKPTGAAEEEVVTGEVLEPASPAPSAEALRAASRSAEVERRLAAARAGRDDAASWSDLEKKKLGRVIEKVDVVLDELVRLHGESPGLSRGSIGEELRRFEVALRHASSAVGELAFAFER